MVSFAPIAKPDLPSLALLYGELLEVNINLASMERQLAQINERSDYLWLGGKMETGELIASLLAIRCLDTTGECRNFMVLENVIVKSTCRKKGVGRQMMAYIEAQAKIWQCDYIILVSSGFRHDAHRFYEAVGYTEDVRGFRKCLL